MKYKHIVFILYGLMIFVAQAQSSYYSGQTIVQTSFENEQLRSPRVWEAKTQKEGKLRHEFGLRNLDYPPKNIYLRAFKKEGMIEVWVQNASGTYDKFKEYTVCASSGRSGPKRQEGDKQVPEGYYFIDEFNANSKYFLSLRISYPNPCDRIMGGGYRLGGDIYIHGKCMTVGCLPLTDDRIKELYWLTVLAHSNGQSQIPIHIFPYKFNNLNFHWEESDQNTHLARFWDNLRIGYDMFETSRTVPNVTYNPDGTYGYW